MLVCYLSEPRIGSAVGRVRAQVLRTGRWLHPNAPNGELVIDRDRLHALARNFRDGIVGYELPVRMEHGGDLVGWITDVELDDEALYATVEMVDPQAYEQIRQGKMRYASAELQLNYTDPEQRQTVDVLRGLAFTNQPYIKRMEPLVTLSESTRMAECRPCQKEAEMTEPIIDEETLEKLVEKAERADALESELARLRTQQTHLSEKVSQKEYEMLLSEHAVRLTPALIDLFTYAFRVANGERIALSEIQARFPQTVYRLELSESELTRPATMQEVLKLLLSEIPTVPRTERPTYVDPTVSLSLRNEGGSRALTQLVDDRANKLARELGISYGDAIKRVVREVL